MITQDMQKTYLSILREELVPATGCTEPIAIAYAAARLRAALGARPDEDPGRRLRQHHQKRQERGRPQHRRPEGHSRRHRRRAWWPGRPAQDAAGHRPGAPRSCTPTSPRYAAETPIEIALCRDPPAAGHPSHRLGRGPHRLWSRLPTTTATSSGRRRTGRCCWRSPSPTPPRTT